ncbi:uncharacterized protein LOC112683919 [Sipha flava]|uniref:Uncharacterized protein LOC112683919 n=1 Tax=Sipha flava TaxID=143950 RepID=A0A8B8FKP0_9HEMI|nr:uncharacterized protein LOC112683919 [Sipha flava]
MKSEKFYVLYVNQFFSIENGGRSDITQHVKQKKHLLAVSSSSSNKVTNFFTNVQSTNESKRIAAEEGLFAYHTIIHNHSFRSMDCTTSIIKKIYEKKFSCARTKCESIIVNVIAPFAIQQMLDELKSVKFLTIMVDTSNHKNLKLVPILIRYFNPQEGVKIKVLEFMNLKGETSNILSDYILNVLKKYSLLNNVVAFSGDNCNTNFGGVSRKGTNNVFAILNEKLKRNISGIGCAAHILHNAMHSSADILPTDIELIINKIFQYFHIYTVRIEKLKDFCDFVSIEYKNILGSVKTRWLSLQPAVSRIIDLYPALKSYFMSQEKCPTVLRTFFNDPISMAWLYFVQSQLKVVCDTIKRIEGDHISAGEVYEEIEVLCGKIKNRKNQHFFTSELAQLISDLEKNKLYSEKKFIEITDEFYDTFLSYVEKWGYHFEPLKVFRWIHILDFPIWSDIQESFKYIIKNNPTLKFDEDELFDEFNHVINVMKVKMQNWKNGSKTKDRVFDGYSRY